MVQYLIKRTAMALIVVVLLAVFLALLVHVVPGDPVTSILGPRATPDLIHMVRTQMELDKPVPRQVVDFVGRAAHGDLGRDFISNVPVSHLIANALPHTIALAVAGLGLAMLLGVPLGVLAATRPNGILDRLTGVVSISLMTTPSYVAGLFLLLLFALDVPWFPAVGTGTFSHPLDYLRHLVLPAVALALGWIGYFARLVRASMLEVMNTNYIRTAYAYGLGERVIFYRHALRNAIIPTVAVLGVGLGELMGGAVFIESIFSRVGLGTLIVDSIQNRNYPVVRGAVLTIALLFVLANLLADLSYRFLDPRIRVEESAAP
ncbi:MAG TPA: ABC transporter permease [Gaiellaceae bacterium]|nr:ABC transporter permease [Gaiellaceae bacterium]